MSLDDFVCVLSELWQTAYFVQQARNVVKTSKHLVSAHFQSMMDPNPVKRPSAKEILGHHIFEKLHTAPSKEIECCAQQVLAARELAAAVPHHQLLPILYI
jgi:hypothetical protein